MFWAGVQEEDKKELDEGVSTLLGALERFKEPKRPLDKPFRMILDNTHPISIKHQTAKGFAVTGKVLSGQLEAGNRPKLIAPHRDGKLYEVLSV